MLQPCRKFLASRHHFRAAQAIGRRIIHLQTRSVLRAKTACVELLRLMLRRAAGHQVARREATVRSSEAGLVVAPRVRGAGCPQHHRWALASPLHTQLGLWGHRYDARMGA